MGGKTTEQKRMPAPALKLYRADGFVARLLGLHAFKRLSWHTGLWLTPCNAVHTFGLAYSIDVVFLGGDNQVLRRVGNMKPNRVALCLAARSVAELPAGYCARRPGYALALRRAIHEACHPG